MKPLLGEAKWVWHSFLSTHHTFRSLLFLWRYRSWWQCSTDCLMELVGESTLSWSVVILSDLLGVSTPNIYQFLSDSWRSWFDNNIQLEWSKTAGP